MAEFKSVRSAEDVEAARDRAQRAAYYAEDHDGHDDAADAVYGLLQWLAGDSDIDVTEEMGDDPGEDE